MWVEAMVSTQQTKILSDFLGPRYWPKSAEISVLNQTIKYQHVMINISSSETSIFGSFAYHKPYLH
jgi:hypothetical protein